jgi:hypothetical protein
MDVSFKVGGKTYVVPERQAAILAENLRTLARSDLADIGPSAAELWEGGDWRVEALQLANSIEETLVHDDDDGGAALALQGGSAAAAYCVLRLMVGMESTAAAGLRDALGAPVPAEKVSWREAHRLAGAQRQLSPPELRELLLVLFVLALLTVIAGDAWTGLWWVLAPAIAALIGLRVATTRATGRLAWSVASILWWAVMLVPAAVVVVLVGLLIVALV